MLRIARTEPIVTPRLWNEETEAEVGADHLELAIATLHRVGDETLKAALEAFAEAARVLRAGVPD
jgi:hypothetical protein